MDHHKRPAHRQWRHDVIQRYGHRCVMCGHRGNIQAHHLQTVHDFPELTLNPENGVPICGNCHAKVTGHEREYFDELKQRQAGIRVRVKTVVVKAPKAAKQSKKAVAKSARSRKIGWKDMAALAGLGAIGAAWAVGGPVAALGTLVGVGWLHGPKKKKRRR